MLLLKLIELVILIVVVKVFIGMIFPGLKQKKPFSGKNNKNKRFDCTGADVSDGEFKDVR